jgi:hypothetical protein
MAARVAEEGAALLLFALGRGGPLRPRSFRGASEEEVRSRFGGDWEIAWKRPHAAPAIFGGAEQSWYLLRKRASLVR